MDRTQAHNSFYSETREYTNLKKKIIKGNSRISDIAEKKTNDYYAL